MVTERTRKILEEDGYDYGVLVKLWNLKVDYSSLEADDLEIKALQDYMNDVLTNDIAGNSGMINKDVNHTIDELGDDLRLFLKELSKYEGTYYNVMWRGMSEIRDNYSLIVISIPIVGFMWD